MNKVKQVLLILALASGLTPVIAVDKPAPSAGGSSLPMTAGIAAACTIVAGGAALCVYRWYMAHKYWSARNVAHEIEKTLARERYDFNSKVVWDNGTDRLIPHDLSRNYATVTVELSFEGLATTGAWHVRRVKVAGGTPEDLGSSRGELVIEVHYVGYHDRQPATTMNTYVSKG